MVSSAVWLRGLNYYRMNEYEIAIHDLNLCIDLKQKEMALAYHYRAKCLMKQSTILILISMVLDSNYFWFLEKWYESIVDNTAAIEANPNIAGAFKDRAEANEIVGRKGDAESDKRIFTMLMSKTATEGELPKE